MKIIFYPANERGYANHNWLEARHSFSFASYSNSTKNNFGVLRVLNDDIVQGGEGFGAHPHDNMEIVTIPLKGALAHKDNTGRNEIIKTGDVQMMSAGTGITHSEFNASETEPVNLLQIWIFPKVRNVEPKYQQITFDKSDFDNQLKVVVSPDKSEKVLSLNQDAWFTIGELKKDNKQNYKIKKSGNGVYAFVIEGSVKISNTLLNKRDGLGIWETSELEINPEQDSKILLMDIPMEIN
ncbi:MAG: pirin family protein [Ignavibacteria bacterium]|nr:pirin family protein [Ignavibacteria bacterium]